MLQAPIVSTARSASVARARSLRMDERLGSEADCSASRARHRRGDDGKPRGAVPGRRVSVDERAVLACQRHHVAGALRAKRRLAAQPVNVRTAQLERLRQRRSCRRAPGFGRSGSRKARLAAQPDCVGRQRRRRPASGGHERPSSPGRPRGRSDRGTPISSTHSPRFRCDVKRRRASRSRHHPPPSACGARSSRPSG